MNMIVAEITEILKASRNVVDVSEQLHAYWAQYQCRMMALALENLDDYLWQEYQKDGARSLRKDRRTLVTLAGETTFRRRLVRLSDGETLYPLDVAMGFKKYERMSPYLQYLVACIAAKCTYRTTADVVNSLSKASISHTQVGTIVKRIGEAYSTKEDADYAKEVTPDAYLKQPKELRTEGDAIVIKGRDGKHLEIHRFQTAEGVEKQGKRRVLTGVHRTAAIKHDEAKQKMKGHLEHHYDLSRTTVLSNSDGGSGYGEDVFSEILGMTGKHEHFRDAYHVNRKCKERLNFVQKELVDDLCRALAAYDKERVEAALSTAESLAQTPAQEDAVDRLRKYLERNWAYLAPLGERGLECRVKGLGTCESGHRLYSFRMKHRGMYWSTEGAAGMVRVITGLANGDLREALGCQVPRFEQQPDTKYKNAVRNALKKVKQPPHIGAIHGSIVLCCPSSSATGYLSQSISNGGFPA